MEILRKVFDRILITEDVLKEVKQTVPDWIEVVNPVSSLQIELLNNLDPGEASCIALAFEQHGSLLIIDEFKGRKTAKELGIQLTGSLGVLISAKQYGYIEFVKSVIEKIEKTNFRISNQLVEKVLKMVNEQL